MPVTPIEILEKEAQKLSLPDHIKLIETLVRQLREKSTPVSRRIDWKELYGIGKGLWGGQDAQDYVNGLREER